VNLNATDLRRLQPEIEAAAYYIAAEATANAGNSVFPRVGGAPARSSPARAREDEPDGRQDEGVDGGVGPSGFGPTGEWEL
jgi:hypothetical protein